MLDQQFYSDKDIAKFINNNFVPIRAVEGEEIYKNLRKIYKIQGLPKETLARADGSLMDKYGDFESKEKLLAKIKNSMKGRTMILRFLSLGPAGSVFSVPCVQATDSWYVAHNEDLLYRTAYNQFCKIKKDDNVFCFLHSCGKLDENMISVDVENKRV